MLCFIHNCYNCYGFITGAIIANGYEIVKFSGKHLSEHSIDQLLRSLFFQIFRKLDLNLSVVTVLNEFAAEVKQEDVTNFITVYAAAKVSGGDSIAIIRDAARTIGEKIDTEREIQTMLAAKKLEFEIMSVIPFIMILYMKMTFGEFLSVLYGTWTGCIVMSICLVLYLGAYRFGWRLLQIEI